MVKLFAPCQTSSAFSTKIDGEPITTEGMRYGFRFAIIGIPCSPHWRTDAGLALVGPQYFGYNEEYVPVEERYR